MNYYTKSNVYEFKIVYWDAILKKRIKNDFAFQLGANTIPEQVLKNKTFRLVVYKSFDATWDIWYEDVSLLETDKPLRIKTNIIKDYYKKQ
jgi:hypothetical protein